MTSSFLPTSLESFYTRLLFKHVEEGNDSKVQEVLKKGANPNMKNEAEETPLHIAAEKGYTKVMQLLLNAHANPYLLKMHSTTIPLKKYIYRPQKYIFLTPLDYACLFDRLESVECLVEKGKYNLNFKPDGITPLEFANKFHCSKRIKAYLRSKSV